MANDTFYVTTPIYYVNDIPHIGHAYSTIAADALARYQRLTGHDVFFLTGADEHGQKVARAASEAGETPQQLADRVVKRFQSLWKTLHISNNDFIRTTQRRHKDAVQQYFQRLFASGDIYLGEYEDWYCTPCETFWTELQLVDGACPDCGRPTEKLKEESYFFRLSSYQDRLLEHYESNPQFIQPESRRNEILSFVSSGLRDLSVSRTSFDWGIPAPMKPKHVVYVWLDALLNYMTALGFEGEDEQLYRRFWPASVHIIGKDILRFHAVYWPAFLMAGGEPLPKQVFAHGWWTHEGRKMSKSLGNVVEPGALVAAYGVDPVRYFLLREVTFGLDGDFSHTALAHRINSDLANDFGNLANRVLTMVERYRDGVTPSPSAENEETRRVVAAADQAVQEIDAAMQKLAFHRALGRLWEFLTTLNRYIDSSAPWKLAKEQSPQLDTVLYTCLEGLRLTALLVSPFMPSKAQQLWEQLGLGGRIEEQFGAEWSRWGGLPAGTRISKGEQLFPRLDEAPKQAPAPAEEAKAALPTVTIDDFQRLDLRVGRIRAAEAVKKSKKLIRLEVDLGDEVRQVVAGIAEHYRPEELVGKNVIVVANLKPTKLMGVESKGMVLAGEDGERLVLASLDGDIAPGGKVR